MLTIRGATMQTHARGSYYYAIVPILLQLIYVPWITTYQGFVTSIQYSFVLSPPSSASLIFKPQLYFSLAGTAVLAGAVSLFYNDSVIIAWCYRLRWLVVAAIIAFSNTHTFLEIFTPQILSDLARQAKVNRAEEISNEIKLLELQRKSVATEARFNKKQRELERERERALRGDLGVNANTYLDKMMSDMEGTLREIEKRSQQKLDQEIMEKHRELERVNAQLRP